MPKKIYKCMVCGRYTLHNDACPYCGGPVRPAHPPRFSPADKYGKYRRMLKLKEVPEVGLAGGNPAGGD